MYVNSAIGAFGGDAPYGRVPAPVERESYTSARDYYNLQGAVWSPIPEAAKEVLGIVHQTPDPLLNDAVMTVMRGHSFLPLYLNPKYMDGRRWEMLAELLRWARSNAPLLRHTVPLLPNSWKDTGPPQFSDHCAMPREPYGYAHWVGDQGLVVLRNPWIEPASYRLRLGAGPSRSSDAAVSVVSLYPEVRLYAKARRLGESMNVPLAPYETVVLSVGAAQSTKGMPWIQDVFKDCCRASCRDLRALIEEFAASPEAIGPSWTSPVGNRTSVARLQFEGDVDIQTPEAELLLLLEGGRSPAALLAELQINGVEKPLEVLRSDLSWAACRPPRPEHWTFLRATLQRGKASLAARVTTDVDLAALSGWVWGYAPGGKTSPCANALPTPERIPLGAVPLFAPMPAGAFSRNPIRVPRPIERIDGVYLDALTPLSAVQGWGALEKNRSVWKKPLTIVGVEYVRGLGTSSQSQIRYGLRGQYRRFQSWVGADAATRPTVTFEVWIDGKKRWESGLMNRDDPAKRCDLDVSGAEILELRVGDGGDGLVADHADWADARLLK
jgi:hypothetical protein